MGRHRSRRIRRGILIAIMSWALAGCTLGAAAPTTVSSPPGATNGPSPVSAGSGPGTRGATVAPGDSSSAGANGPTPGPTPISAWRPGAHRSTTAAPSGLLRAGTLTVGSDLSGPPQAYVDGAGRPIGFDMDVAAELASRLGLTLTVVNAKFDDIIMNLNSGRFDVVISAVTIKPEREQVVQFVPYFSAGQAGLVQAGNPQSIHTLDDLAGKTVATEQGTAEEDTLHTLNIRLEAAGKPKVTVLIYAGDLEAVAQLRQGRAVATLHDSPVAAYYAALDPTAFTVGIPAFAVAPEGIGVAKGNSAIFQAVTAAVQAMQGDGTMDVIKTKWGLK
ncbi:MAG: ABC transporter substrate-binding protein [Chloroflexota bacterium]|nr:ABC transporter substrate-binding protein [Chloroflexota bacterium]